MMSAKKTKKTKKKKKRKCIFDHADFVWLEVANFYPEMDNLRIFTLHSMQHITYDKKDNPCFCYSSVKN